jgi:hypothetical protein
VARTGTARRACGPACPGPGAFDVTSLAAGSRPKVSPAPPAAWLAANVPPVVSVLEPSDLVWRIYGTGGRHPQAWNTFRTFGPIASFRFDHHEPGPPAATATTSPTGRGIYYGARDLRTTFAEAFQQTRSIDRFSLSPELAGATRLRPLDLLDLTPGSAWPIKAGAAAVLQFSDVTLCRDWSCAIYEAYPTVHGVAYVSTLTGLPVYALYERAQSAFPRRPTFRRRLSSPALSATLNVVAVDLGGWPII